MRKIVKAGLLCASAMMLMAGCSNEEAKTETTAAVGTATESEAAAEKTVGEIKSLAEYENVAVEIPEVPEITDEDVERQIQAELSANPIVAEITDRGAENGDVVNIDYTGYKDDEAFEGGTDTGFDLELGSGTFIDGFEEGLLGVKAGDQRDLNLTFPDPYQNPDLAGADVVFKVTVNQVKSVTPAELNDEFVKRVSDLETVDEYREYIREELVKAREMSIDNYIGTMVMNNLVENSDVVCDSEELEAAYETQRVNLENQMMMYGLTVENYLSMIGQTQEEYEEQLKLAAEYSVKQEMILNAIIEAEGIEADDAAREKVAAMYGDTVDTMVGIIGQDMMDDMAAMQNALDYLTESADVTVVESTEASETEAEQ